MQTKTNRCSTSKSVICCQQGHNKIKAEKPRIFAKYGDRDETQSQNKHQNNQQKYSHTGGKPSHFAYLNIRMQQYFKRK